MKEANKDDKGSSLVLIYSLNDSRAAKEIFDKYTEDFTFVLKSPRLVSPFTIKLPPGEFPSRSEAKKILAGAEQFKSIVVDFKDVDSIGQGFADEMFRVFPKKHLNVEIQVENANEFINKMIQHVQKK